MIQKQTENEAHRVVEGGEAHQQSKQQQSQKEGPAAYAPHDEGEKKDQGIVRDERGQEQPADKKRAQQTSSRRQYGQDDPPLENAERAFPGRDPATKKTGEF